MSALHRVLRSIKRASAYAAYFMAMHTALAAYTLIEMSWFLLHPGNVTSSSDWLVSADSNLRYWLGLPPRVKREKAKEQELYMNEAIDGGEPDYLWSENAHWILSVYEPWERGDGYSEEAVSEAETLIGTRLPDRLRSFYRSWGKREDITGSRDYLILPDARLVFPNAVVIAVENQGTIYWSILRNSVAEPNPPVQFAEIDWSDGTDTPNVGPWRLSHGHVSDFLDGLAVSHAFAKGAIRGAGAHTSASETHRQRQQINDLGQWAEVEINSVPWTIIPDSMKRRWPVFVGDGVVIDFSFGVLLAANNDEKVDEVADLLQVLWQDRW